MGYKLFTSATIAVVGSTLILPTLAGQQPDSRLTRADIIEIRTLLNRPGGLEILAKRRKHFLIDNQPELWSDLSLATLMDASSEIAFVTIQSRNSRLISKGDDIITDYVFRPVEIFKGTFSNNEVFSALGGKVVFHNGTSAEISTIEWRNFKVGSQYILFLKESDDHYDLANGVEAAFQISPDGATLKALPSFDESQRPYAILKDVSKHTPDSFKAFLRSQAAGKSKPNI